MQQRILLCGVVTFSEVTSSSTASDIYILFIITHALLFKQYFTKTVSFSHFKSSGGEILPSEIYLSQSNHEMEVKYRWATSEFVLKYNN